MNNEERYLSRSLDERRLINEKYKFLKVAHLHDILGMHDRQEISYSRMVEVINELAFDFYREVVSDVSLANFSSWVVSMRTPEYDGKYLCLVHQPQPCGNTWEYQKVVELRMNQWVLDADERVVYWRTLPKPPC